jgi:hypothetical protein
MPLSSHAERTEVSVEREPPDANVLDPGHPRTLAKQVKESFQRRRAALRFYLHGAIVAVAHEPLKAEPPGMRLGKIPEANPLDIANDLSREAAPFFLRRL